MRLRTGLGSNRSIWLGPPFMKSWMAARAWGGWWGGRGWRVAGLAVLGEWLLWLVFRRGSSAAVE